MSGYDETTARVGYLWAEFARRNPNGPTQHFTCGTRLAAKPGGGGSHCWFTTSQRVGGTLELMDENRRPLTPQALRTAVAEHGTVWGDDANGYRNAVRTSIYSEFSPEDYQSLIDGLLTVRKQSITDGLTPARLNQLLTDGLPGLDPDELDHVARGSSTSTPAGTRSRTWLKRSPPVRRSPAGPHLQPLRAALRRRPRNHATSNLDGITAAAAPPKTPTAPPRQRSSPPRARSKVTATLGTLDVREQAIPSRPGTPASASSTNSAAPPRAPNPKLTAPQQRTEHVDEHTAAVSDATEAQGGADVADAKLAGRVA